MLEKIFKQYLSVVKDIDDKEKTIVANVSTGDVDRDGEVIPPASWQLDNYNKNPVILWAHNYHETPIAKALWTKVDSKGLIQKIKFADTPKGNEAFYLYKEGFLNAFSVGFKGARDVNNNTIFVQAELFEVSAVPVPANPNALMERMASGSIKELKSDIEEELKLVDETETSIRIRIRDPKLFQDDSFRTIDISKDQGIQAVVGKLKGEDKMTIQNYMFAKDKEWTVAKAKKWVKDNEEGKMIIVEIIKNQVDEKYVEALKDIANLKQGRVLSGKNRVIIESAVKALKDLLSATDDSERGLDEEDQKDKKSLDKQENCAILTNKNPDISVDYEKIKRELIKDLDVKSIINGEIRKLQGKV